MCRSIAFAGLIVLAAALADPAAAQDPASFFQENCASCHSIGGGVIAGPDLKGVTARRDREWLIRLLVDPDSLTDDPIRRQLIKEADGLAMGPTDGLTRDLAEKLLALIAKQSDEASSTPAADAFAPFTPDEIALGRAIFEGRTRLAARGPSCAACHRGGDLPAFSGGRLAPDLTNVHDRLGGDQRVAAWLGATPSPMMRSLYKDARLTAEEARALAAFLGIGSDAPARSRALAPHVLGGFGGGVLAMAVIGGLGYRRFRSVRRPLVESARRRTHSTPGRHTLGGLR